MPHVIILASLHRESACPLALLLYPPQSLVQLPLPLNQTLRLLCHLDALAPRPQGYDRNRYLQPLEWRRLLLLACCGKKQ